MFAYCSNNPTNRLDEEGDAWLTAVGIGFAAGVIGQYICYVVENVQSGVQGIDILKPTSSFVDYARACGVVSNKVMSAIKVNEIDGMSRTMQKQYLKNNITFSSQSSINVDYRTYNSLSFPTKMSLVENKMHIFKLGVYTTAGGNVTSTIINIYGEE